MFYKEYLEKIAARKKKDETASGMNFDERAKKERALIEKYKNSTNSFEKMMALNDLKMAYRDLINNCISQSNLTSIMDFADAQRVAENNLKNIFEKFDLSVPVRPATYIMGRLNDELKRERYNSRDNVVRRSTDMQMKNEYMKVSEPILTMRFGRKPTADEMYDHITNELGKKIEKKDVVRNLKLNRSYLSGNQQIGSEDSAAEVMTLMDMKNTDKHTPEELLNNQFQQQKVDSILNSNFSRPERKMIRSYYGLGEFKGNAINANRAAQNNNMSYYEAKKVIERFENILDEQGI